MRRGSLEYWPHRRARNLLPRVRTWQDPAEPTFYSFIAFKAGMTHVYLTDESESPSKGQEVMRSATAIVFPKIFIYGIRLHDKKYIYKEPAGAVYDSAMAQKVGIKSTKNTNLESAKKRLADCVDVTALAFADPSDLGIGIKKLIRFEMHVGGKTLDEKFSFIEKHLGKEVKPGDVMSTGEYLDVVGITKGKGWAGVIKRFGVAKQWRKATNKVRHVGVLGAWHPPKVLFSVPQAGHMGYNYRTELNKKILKMGSAQDAQSVNSKGGFLKFGDISSDYVLLDGSIPGPARRMLRIRKAIRANAKPAVAKITYISTSSKQGA